MDRDTIIRLAQECQLIGMRPHLDGMYQEALERFAALVAAHERERCAKMCDFYAERIGTGNLTGKALIATAFEMRKGS